MDNKVYNALQYFFAKRYSNAVASDYLKTGKLVKHVYGYDFQMPLCVYHFDSLMNFKSRTIY